MAGRARLLAVAALLLPAAGGEVPFAKVRKLRPQGQVDPKAAPPASKKGYKPVTPSDITLIPVDDYFAWNMSGWSECTQPDCSVFGTQNRTVECVSSSTGRVAEAKYCQVCEDVSGWRDSAGDRCSTYVGQQWCSTDGGEGPNWDGSWGTIEGYAANGHSAATACCGCGGGETKSDSDPASVQSCQDLRRCDAIVTTTMTSTTTTTTATTTTTTRLEFYFTNFSSCVQDDCNDFGKSSREVSCTYYPGAQLVDIDRCLECVDVASFKDTDGWSCKEYNMVCENGEPTAAWNPNWGPFEAYAVNGQHAGNSCCNCRPNGGNMYPGEDFSILELPCWDNEKCPNTVTSTVSSTTRTITTTLLYRWGVDEWGNCSATDCSRSGVRHRDPLCLLVDLETNETTDEQVDLSWCANTPDCADTIPGFADSFGDTCEKYRRARWCSEEAPYYGPGWQPNWGRFEDYARDGLTVLDACCGCGSAGIKNPYPSPKQDDLREVCYAEGCTSSTTTTTTTKSETRTTTKTTTVYTGVPTTVTTITVTTTINPLTVIPIRWHPGEWTTCSQPSCAEPGFMTRNLECMITTEDGEFTADVRDCQALEECVPFSDLWVDTLQRTCQDYVDDGLCLMDGREGPLMPSVMDFSDFRRLGLHAGENCCQCGGGKRLFMPAPEMACQAERCLPTWVPSDWDECQQASCAEPGSQSRTVLCTHELVTGTVPMEECLAFAPCADTVEWWSDSLGATCKDYAEQGLCHASGYGPGWADRRGSYQFSDYAVDGQTAADVCCSCGGGAPVTPPTTQSCVTDACSTTTTSATRTTTSSVTKTGTTTQSVTETREPAVVAGNVSALSFVLDVDGAFGDADLPSVLEPLFAKKFSVPAEQVQCSVAPRARRLQASSSFRLTFGLAMEEADVANADVVMGELMADPAGFFAATTEGSALGGVSVKVIVSDVKKGDLVVRNQVSQWSTCQAMPEGVTFDSCSAGTLIPGKGYRTVGCEARGSDGSFVAVPKVLCSTLAPLPVEQDCLVEAASSWACTGRAVTPARFEVTGAKGSFTVTGWQSDADPEVVKEKARLAVANALSLNLEQITFDLWVVGDAELSGRWLALMEGSDQGEGWASIATTTWNDMVPAFDMFRTTLEAEGITWPATAQVTSSAAEKIEKVTAGFIMSSSSFCHPVPCAVGNPVLGLCVKLDESDVPLADLPRAFCEVPQSCVVSICREVEHLSMKPCSADCKTQDSSDMPFELPAGIDMDVVTVPKTGGVSTLPPLETQGSEGDTSSASGAVAAIVIVLVLLAVGALCLVVYCRRHPEKCQKCRRRSKSTAASAAEPTAEKQHQEELDVEAPNNVVENPEPLTEQAQQAPAKEGDKKESTLDIGALLHTDQTDGSVTFEDRARKMLESAAAEQNTAAQIVEDHEAPEEEAAQAVAPTAASTSTSRPDWAVTLEYGVPTPVNGSVKAVL